MLPRALKMWKHRHSTNVYHPSPPTPVNTHNTYLGCLHQGVGHDTHATRWDGHRVGAQWVELNVLRLPNLLIHTRTALGGGGGGMLTCECVLIGICACDGSLLMRAPLRQ